MKKLEIVRILKVCFCNLWMLLAICLIAESVEAKTMTGYSNKYAYKSGRYIYYTAPENELMRYDTKTGKIKKLYSCKVYSSYTKQKELTNGFSDLKVKGKYIYVQWTKGHGTGGPGVQESYIYRISKNGKKAKKLAMGANPVIIGSRIYYDEVKKVYQYGEWWYEETQNKMSMKLNGKGKRNENVTIKVKNKKMGKYKIKVKEYSSCPKDKKGNFYNQALILTKPNGKKIKLATWFMS